MKAARMHVRRCDSTIKLVKSLFEKHIRHRDGQILHSGLVHNVSAATPVQEVRRRMLHAILCKAQRTFATMLLKLAAACGFPFQDELCFRSPWGTKPLPKEAGGDGDEIPLGKIFTFASCVMFLQPLWFNRPRNGMPHSHLYRAQRTVVTLLLRLAVDFVLCE